MLVSRGTSVWIRFGCPFSSKIVVCGHCLLTLPLTVNETIKWLSSMPILMQESFWWWQCGDRYIIYLRTPFSLSLISLMVSVDVKPHAYLGGLCVCLLVLIQTLHRGKCLLAWRRHYMDLVLIWSKHYMDVWFTCWCGSDMLMIIYMLVNSL